MKVIPVIDILNGVVVHAVRGRRSEYKPLQSVLCASAEPLEVASAFKALGFSELYVADLDAILAGHPNFSVLRQMAGATGLRLMVDAGVADFERARMLLEGDVSEVVVGTETLADLSFVGEAVEVFGKRRVVVSLDLKGGAVLSLCESNEFSDPLGLLREFSVMGVEQIILLDLDRVGSGEGVDMRFLKQALENRELKLFVGGGVRGTEDLVELRSLGVSGALVATALHSGKITLKELRRTGFL
ncbi:MAG: HisA/HisF-related TIM barrel protein [Candidatus Bathyarchaeota archaeon]|nr:HisA/HisF-related TIM barrel protein [Candidatus Bathyarchaeota archaeon]